MADYVDYERHLVVQFIKDTSTIDIALNNPEFDKNCFKDKLALNAFKWIKRRYQQNKPISKIKFHTESNVDAQELLKYDIPFEIENKNIEDVIDYLIKLKSKRILNDAANKIKKLVRKKDIEKKELENKAQELIFNVTNDFHENQGIYSMSDALEKLHEEFWEAQEGKSKLSGVPTGITSLDWALNGLPKKHLSVIAASTSRGKTSLAILVTLNAVKNGLKSANISLEMEAIEVVRKMVALDSLVPTSLFTKKFTDYEGKVKNKLENIFVSVKNNMNQAMNKLHELDLYISDTRGLDTTDIKARCRNIKREMGGLDIVVVDYLQMINMQSIEGDNKEQKTGQAVLELRNMASELNCHVMVLSQFHRVNTDGKPRMSHMRDSGRIEEIADEIILPYRPNFEDEDGTREEAKLIIDKGRTKGRSEIDMYFYPKIQYWRCAVDEDEQGPLDYIDPDI